MDKELTQQRLKEVLSYDPDTGVFTWARTTRGWVKAGRVAGRGRHQGYSVIGVDGATYAAHRLAWLYVYGCWPDECVDHRNGVRDDNRMSNLRECAYSENSQNMCKRSDNTTGYTGVKWYKRTQQWAAAIGTEGRLRHLGIFGSAEEAYQAYLAAKAQLHTFQPAPREAA